MPSERERLMYVASRASIPDRSAMWRQFRGDGWPINSSWIDEAGEGETECNTALWARIQREITEAVGLILYAEAGDFPLKGALVEVGMALALDKPVFVVLRGVELQPHTMRPLGSWSKHPRVCFVASVPQALALASQEVK